jgi:putative tryptophan/tyrosine transport system substrate-binding protein
MDRRTFVILAGGLLAAPLTAQAQRSAIPVVGFLCSAPPVAYTPFVVAFRQGLSEAGYVERKNVAIEFRWAEGHYDRLPGLASDLVRRQVAVLVATGGDAPVLAAKAATAQIPIVFASGGDPVKAGVVASLNRPGGNVTGVNVIFTALVPKQVELLHELVPQAATIGALVNPNYPDVDLQRRELQEAATVIKQPIHVVSAGAERDIDAVFRTLVQQKTDALLVANDPFFVSRRDQIAALAARHAIPAIYSEREYTVAGGLMSYGASLRDAFRQVGIYAGRILKGAKPADLPVEQPTRFELIINLKTAKALGLTIPPSLLQRADQVIE